MKFAKDSVAKLTLPDGKTDAIVFDDDLPGFGIRLRAGGKRVWIVQYRNAAGKTRRLTLGDTRKLDLDKARQKAKIEIARVTLGGDPRAEKAEAKSRSKLTLSLLANRFLEFKRPRLRPNTYNADKRYLTQHWKPLHKVPVHAITRREVAARLTEIVQQHGATSAARARGALSAFFAWAIREGIAEANPVVGTNDPAVGIESRDRVLSPDEIRIIWNCCRDDDFGTIVKLLMLTGARRDEIGGLRWHEIDLDRGMLHIPGDRTKNRRPLVLTLAPLALSILKSVPRREGREFVFGGRGGAFSAWSYSTLALLARISEGEGKALAPWRLHDIRRSVATQMADIGVQPHIVEAVINHVGHKAGVAGTYNRATYEREIKSALALWADHIRSVVECGERKVMPLQSA
jgi:integrase